VHQDEEISFVAPEVLDCIDSAEIDDIIIPWNEFREQFPRETRLECTKPEDEAGMTLIGRWQEWAFNLGANKMQEEIEKLTPNDVDMEGKLECTDPEFEE